MSFINPLSVLLFLSVQSFNLFQMNPDLAKDLSGQYTMLNPSESVQLGTCPNTFDIELISSAQPDAFILKNRVQYKNFAKSKPRLLPIDGQIHHMLKDRWVKAEVTEPNAIKVQVFNKKAPDARLVETFKFEEDGTLIYSTDLQSKGQLVASLDPICQETRYKKLLN